MACHMRAWPGLQHLQHAWWAEATRSSVCRLGVEPGLVPGCMRGHPIMYSRLADSRPLHVMQLSIIGVTVLAMAHPMYMYGPVDAGLLQIGTNTAQPFSVIFILDNWL